MFFRFPAYPIPFCFLLANEGVAFSASLSALSHSALICSLIERVSFEAGRGVVCPSAEDALASKKTNSTIVFKHPNLICASTVPKPGELSHSGGNVSAMLRRRVTWLTRRPLSDGACLKR